MNQEDQQNNQGFDFSSYDMQGYDVQPYEEQGFDTQAYAAEGEDAEGYYEEQPFEAAPPVASASTRVPQAAPAYDDAGGYEDDDDEDFPEPEAAPKKKGGNGRTAVLAGVGALVAGGAFLFLNPLGLDLSPITSMLPEEVVAMLPTGDPAAEEAPAPEDQPPADQAPVEPPPADNQPAADSKEWQEPTAVTPQAATPKPPAAKPAAPKPAAKPPAAAKPAVKPPAPVAKKPAPKPAAPVAAKPKPAKPMAAKPAMVGGPAQASTMVRFERHSAWVAAAEMERLWAFSSKIKDGRGHLTVEGVAGSEREASELAKRRAIRIAELLQKNNVGNQYKFTVKAVTSPGDSPRVNVTYSQKL
jgi:hypothetical protein